MDSTMKELVSHSIQVNSGMIQYYPNYGREEEISVSETIRDFPHCYSISENSIGFIYANHLYVTPYTSLVVKILEDRDFEKVNFKVPFGDGSCPKYAMKTWKSLCDVAIKSNDQEFHIQCEKFSDAHHIGSISDEALKNCFIMPNRGVLVKCSTFENRYYPVIKVNRFTVEVIENIGTYHTQKGITVFVYRDGYTYVTKRYKIIHELVGAGYKVNRNLFVPFTNGEEIVEYELYKKWESVSE